MTLDPVAEFTAWFVRNYPGPDTIIHDPKWHAPRILRAAQHALGVAAPSGQAPLEGVKALEWRKTRPDSQLSYAETIVGIYRVWTHHEANGEWYWGRDGGCHAVPSEEAGKAAAQSSFAATVRSALLPAPTSSLNIETIAKAIAANHGWDGDNALIKWRDFEGDARAAIAALLPASAEPVAYMKGDATTTTRGLSGEYLAKNGWTPLYASPPASGAVEAGWQDIATAPKDRPILGWNDHETAYICQWLYDEDGDGDWLEYGTDVVNPVRWMPLPAAPTEGR